MLHAPYNTKGSLIKVQNTFAAWIFSAILIFGGSDRASRSLLESYFHGIIVLYIPTYINTVTKNHSGMFAVLWCKTTIFRREKHKVNVM